MGVKLAKSKKDTFTIGVSLFNIGIAYRFNSDYENEGTRFLIGKKDYTEYEKMLESKIIEHDIKKVTFSAKKGDLLIWHANLLHGGSKINEVNLTRKSMVAHYYAEGVLCYHEISQRPAIIKKR